MSINIINKTNQEKSNFINNKPLLKNKYNFIGYPDKLTDFEDNLKKWEQIRYIENPNKFYKETAYNRKVDGKISYFHLFSKIKHNPYYRTRGSGYLTHSFSPYHGSFHGQMIRGLINYCNLSENARILDIFMGSGTTLVEANLLGFNAIGMDINPFACLLSKVKTGILAVPLDRILKNNSKYFDISYYKIYQECNFNEILKLDIKEQYYLFLYLDALKLNKRFGTQITIAFRKKFIETMRILSQFELIKDLYDIKSGKSEIFLGNSYNYLKAFKTHSINCIITSPPYIDLIDYIQDSYTPNSQFLKEHSINKIRQESIGHKCKNIDLTEQKYYEDIREIFTESFRVLKSGSYFIVIIGEYRNMRDRYKEIALEQEFYIERIVPKGVITHKRKNRKEYILFLKKTMNEA